MSSRQQNKGLTGLLNKLDFTRECYVLMSRDQKTVLLDGATGQPWHTYNKNQALNMQTILCKEDNIDTAVVTFVQALCHLASLEGVKLTPPFTMQNISNQLIDAARPRQHAIQFEIKQEQSYNHVVDDADGHNVIDITEELKDADADTVDVDGESKSNQD